MTAEFLKYLIGYCERTIHSTAPTAGFSKRLFQKVKDAFVQVDASKPYFVKGVKNPKITVTFWQKGVFTLPTGTELALWEGGPKGTFVGVHKGQIQLQADAKEVLVAAKQALAQLEEGK